MDATTIEFDFEKAAGFVARGNDLDLAAAKAKIPFGDLKEYTIDYANDWNRIIKHERAQMLGQAGAEALIVLRKLIRDGEEKTQVAAATILMKFWMTTLRHDKGGNAFDVLEGGLSDEQFMKELEAEDKLAVERAAALAAKNAPKPEIEPPVTTPVVPTIETPPCDVPETVEAKVELAVEVPSVPEKPIRLDNIEYFPTLNPNRSGLLAYERYERRPLSHDRGGG